MSTQSKAKAFIFVGLGVLAERIPAIQAGIDSTSSGDIVELADDTDQEAVMSTIEAVSQALAGIKYLSVAECEREFNCKLTLDDYNPRQYWGTSTDPSIDLLDIRIGETGGIVVVKFNEDFQQVLAVEVEALGPREDCDIVSPPAVPDSPPAWTYKWSDAHIISGAKIWFGFEEIDGETRLVSASRSFSKIGSAR